MNYTTNLELRKPEGTDFYDIADQNFNMDTIDAYLSTVHGNLSELGDVGILSPTDGQILKWDGVNRRWINADGAFIIVLTRSQYNALPATKTSDGKLYVISDEAGVVVDSSLSPSSTNPVQNKVVKRALEGFAAKSTTFNSNGSITETDASGNVKTTVFESNGSITETLKNSNNVTLVTKTTTFGPNGVTEVIS